MKIDIAQWHAELEVLLEKHLKEDTTLSKKPTEFFDGFFCDAGFPTDVYPIWTHDGIVIYVDAMPYTRFDLRTGRWMREGVGEYHRIFWVSDEGVLGEVSDDEGRLTEFFPVKNPTEVAEYFQMLRSQKLVIASNGKMRNADGEDLIEDVYVRFFRFPDDLTEKYEELPWVNLATVQDLVKEHIKESLQWMDLPLAELKRLRLLDLVKQRSFETKMINVEVDAEQLGKKNMEELVLGLFLGHQEQYKALKARCFAVASALKDADVLPDSATTRLVPTTLHYAFDGFHSCQIELGIKLSEIALACYLIEDVNPKGYELIRNSALSRVSEDHKVEKTTIELPSLFDQRRQSFESRSYLHQIHQQSQRLARIDVGQSSKPTAQDLHKFLANRFEEVTYLADRVPEFNSELERAKHPLPYFIEVGFLAWERAPEKLKMQNGMACFGNLIRIIALLGLTELQTNPSKPMAFLVPVAEVMKGIQGNPSLGHWSRFLDRLGEHLESLQFFRGWVEALLLHRKTVIKLIELRNEHAHPSSVIDQSMLDDLVSKLHGFLTEISYTLRQSSGSLSVFVSQARKLIRAKTGNEYQLSGFDLASPYDRFFEATHTLSEKNSSGLAEDELTFVTKNRYDEGKRFLSVDRFFRFREMKPGVYEVLIYEKGFDGKSGLFTGISTGVREKLPMEADSFEV